MPQTPFVDVDSWPRVECRGVVYAVAPRYLGPIGIGEADETARHHGCELPGRDLVDRIWETADCKLDARQFVRKHDGTPRTMASPAVLLEQRRKIEAAIVEWESAHGPAQLVAGCCKDVIVGQFGGLALYGWQRPDGTVIQSEYRRHARVWIDYSQGARLVRRVT